MGSSSQSLIDQACSQCVKALCMQTSRVAMSMCELVSHTLLSQISLLLSDHTKHTLSRLLQPSDSKLPPPQDYLTCISTPDCYSHVLANQIQLQPTAESARALVTSHPETYDALLAFVTTPLPNDVAAAAAQGAVVESQASAAGFRTAAAGPMVGLPLMYSISMNHSDVPAPGMHFDLFDVIPSRENALSLYQR